MTTPALKALVRADARSQWDDVVNRIVDRDKGRSTDNVIWRFDSASVYALDIDNASGKHANFGSGIFTIADSVVDCSTLFELDSGNTLRFWNAAQNNSVDIVHSGTNDILQVSKNLRVLQNFAWLSGTNFTVTLDHAATVNRVVTVQNVDGTMAILGSSENAGGNLLFTDNTYDIGASGTSRPKNLYLAGNAVIGGTASVSGQPVGLVSAIVHLGSNYTLTNAYADIGLATGTLAVGTYLITAVVDFDCTAAGDVGLTFSTKIVVGTATATFSNSSAQAIFVPAANGSRATVPAQWVANVTVAGTLKLQATKGAVGAGAASQIIATTTSIAATT